MAEEKNNPEPQVPEVNRCSGDCMNCSFSQQIYCASQIAHNMQNAIAGMAARLAELQGEVTLMREQLNSQKLVSAPVATVKGKRAKGEKQDV